MAASTIVALAIVLQLSALAAFLLGYSVLLYKKMYTPGSVVWFSTAALLHVFLWFQYCGEANRQMFKQGAYANLWQGITLEHQAVAASIFIAVGYLFCVILGAVAVIIVMKTREELTSNKPSKYSPP